MTTLVILDDSAWLRRYTGEPGCEVLDYLWDEAVAHRLHVVSSALSHAALLSALMRYRSRVMLDDTNLAQLLRRIEIDASGLLWLNIPLAAFFNCAGPVVKYGLRPSDAVLLSALIDLQRMASRLDVRVLLVSTDKRLLNAAAGEKLTCLDPAINSLREAAALIAG